MQGKGNAVANHRRHADGGGRPDHVGRRSDDMGQRPDDVGRPTDDLARPNGADPLGDAEPSEGNGSHGRSSMSPGHLKKEAGAQSAREFAPGHARKRQG